MYVVEREWIDENYFDDVELYNDAKKKLSQLRMPQVKIVLI